ncbi:MAG: M1 family aminopeptidase [Polyangiales bacterium]
MRPAQFLACLALLGCEAHVALPLDASTAPRDVADVADVPVAEDVPRAMGSFHGRAFDTYDPTLPGFDAIGYDIELRVDGAPAMNETFAASLTGTFVATGDIDAITLDFEGNTVDATEVEGAAVTATREGAALRVPLDRPRRAGEVFHATVRYHGALLQSRTVTVGDFVTYGGLIAARPNGVGEGIFLSLDWPMRGRRWLPMRDHPRDGVMVAMRATFPSALTVLSNGRRGEVTDNADGTRTWRYECLTQMPSYDIHVSAYEGWTEGAGVAPASGAALRWYTYRQHASRADGIFGDVPAALDYFAANFGPFRWEQAGFAEVPIFGGGMEHATIVSMDESLYAPDGAATSRQTAVHELAHHWSGNLVRIGSWNDFWLSEGFTEYLTARFITEHDGAAAGRAVWDNFLGRATNAEMRLTRVRHPVRPPDPEVDPLSIFDQVSYQRGAWTLRMIERRVGTANLTEFLRGWFTRHAERAVFTADLERELAARFPAAELPRFFQEWVYGQGFPVLSATVEGGTLTVAQVQTRGADEGLRAPLDVLASDGARTERLEVQLVGRSSAATLPAGFAPTSITLDPDGWLYALARCDTPGAECRAGTRCGTAPVGRVCLPQ